MIFWGTIKREIMVTLLPVKVQWKDIEHKYTFDLELNSGQTHTHNYPASLLIKAPMADTRSASSQSLSKDFTAVKVVVNPIYGI